VRLCIVALTLLASSSALVAQEPTEPKYPRFDLTPLFGYRTTMSFGIDPQDSRTNPRVVLDSDPSYGFAFGARFNQEDVIEFRWAKQDSHIHVEDFGAISSRQRVTLNQFHGDFTHEYFVDEWPAWARPYVIGSVGATRLSGGGNDFTRFSFGIGGGVKLFAGRHAGLRLQAQWVPILLSPEVAIACGVGCIVRVGGNLSSQGEFVVGPVFRF
jgi:hypothetical protein